MDGMRRTMDMQREGQLGVGTRDLLGKWEEEREDLLGKLR